MGAAAARWARVLGAAASLAGPIAGAAVEAAVDTLGRARPDTARADDMLAPDADLEVGAVGIGHQGPHLVVDVTIDHLLDRGTAAVLEDAVPATVLIDVELWRERGTWFDRLEASRHLISRIQLDVWDEVYEILNLDEQERKVTAHATLEEALEVVCKRGAIVVGATDLLDEERQYYLVVSAALKPWTLEDVEELEEWLSGGIKTGRSRGFGILGIPKQLFGMLLDLTGLGDRNDRMRTRNFTFDEVMAGATLERR